jgi:hypothetical protein
MNSGGVIDDLIVYRFSDADYRIVVNAGTADKDVAWMRSAYCWRHRRRMSHCSDAPRPGDDRREGANARQSGRHPRRRPPHWFFQAANGSLPAPATPARTASRSPCRRATPPALGALLGVKPCGSAPATPCASKPA